MLVLEGNHFKQEGEVTIYVGGRKVEQILSREHRTLIVELPDDLTGRTARVRVGKLRSNSVRVYGLEFARKKKASAEGDGGQEGPGINQALGGH